MTGRAREMYRSFAEFWPHYLRKHADPETRSLHLVGAGLASASLLAVLVTRNPRWLLLGLPGAYALSWFGHAQEGKLPATFDHPVWSLRGEIRMVRYWLTGRLDAELKRVVGGSEADVRPLIEK